MFMILVRKSKDKQKEIIEDKIKIVKFRLDGVRVRNAPTRFNSG